jgi:enoyl-CoA hydratase
LTTPQSRNRETSMGYEHLLVEEADGVAILTLDRPAKLNALDRRLSADLHAAVKAAEANDAIGCIVITGAGDRAFSAGGDINEQREIDRIETQAESNAYRAQAGRHRFEIGACAKPTIGMINGLAYGGAAVLATSLDMRVGCEHARFRFLAAGYGRINGTWTLPNQVGWPVAKELMFSGREVLAEEARHIGLLNHLVPCAELRVRTLALAATIVANDRAAVMGLKALLTENLGSGLEEQWSNEATYTTEVLRAPKAEEAFASFIDRKRRPGPS